MTAGEYTCAPKTKSGVSREFDEADISALFVYGHLMRIYKPAQYSKKIAARYACEVINGIRALKRNGNTRADFPLNGFNYEFLLCDPTEPPYYESDPIPLAAKICFDLAIILKTVRDGMADEANIICEED